MQKIILFILVIWACSNSFAQSMKNDTIAEIHTDTSKNGIGGELKGIYVLGSIAIAGGTGLGIYAQNYSDGGREGVSFPIIAGGIALAPASLIGLGLGSLIAKKHSKINESFQIGIGYNLSSVAIRRPPFEEEPETEYVSGLSIRIVSPEIGHWRYHLGINHFFSRDYEFFNGFQEVSWQTINLNLQYVIHITRSLRMYPFIGSQFRNFVKDEIYTNFGLGIHSKMTNNMVLFGEVKGSYDPDESPSFYSFAIGTAYYLR